MSVTVLIGMGWLGGIRLNLTPSYSLGLWRIEALDRAAAVGDLVFICPPDSPPFRSARERGYIRRGLCPGWLSPLIKTVAAIEGQRVDIGASVAIGGRLLAHSQLHAADAKGVRTRGVRNRTLRSNAP